MHRILKVLDKEFSKYDTNPQPNELDVTITLDSLAKKIKMKPTELIKIIGLFPKDEVDRIWEDRQLQGENELVIWLSINGQAALVQKKYLNQGYDAVIKRLSSWKIFVAVAVFIVGLWTTLNKYYSDYFRTKHEVHSQSDSLQIKPKAAGTVQPSKDTKLLKRDTL